VNIFCRTLSLSGSVIEEEPSELDGGQIGTQMKKEDQRIGTDLIEKESVETGSVSSDVYLYYMRCIGIVGALLGVGMQLLYQV
jgi:hypothetical protein